MQLILISGLSGAGKSTALKILEDSGYYCVDNLPIPMLEQLISLYTQNNYQKIALSVDTRSSPMLEQLSKSIKTLQHQGVTTQVIYLDAKTDVLIKRFSETRRKHPLSDGENTIGDCIIQERHMLEPIEIIAHKIDTSDLSANTLRNFIKHFVNADYSQLNIVIQSFGFKYGLPIDSDFVFDVRCLANPYYDPQIRDFNGTEQPIIAFLDAQTKVQEMCHDIFNLISKWLNEFAEDNRNYLTISIGCTGGKHRSVYIVEALAHMLKQQHNYQILTRHRQIAHD